MVDWVSDREYVSSGLEEFAPKPDFDLLLPRLTPDGYAIFRASENAVHELARLIDGGRVLGQVRFTANAALDLFKEKN